MGFVSFAQAREDVLLWRALATRVHHDVGFYIDVGAYHPDHDSVTRVFYERGWRGVNAEPVASLFQPFPERRPRDVNLMVAVSDQPGEVLFHEIVGHQLGTIVDKYAQKHEQAGMESRTYKVPSMTLTDICERHAADREIHFLKIDVEGHEANVVRSMDFKRFRPWVLVIEATEPNRNDIPTFQEWEGDVCGAGYTFVQSYAPNRYYIADEHPELASAFVIPPDDYELVEHHRRREALEEEVEALRRRVSLLERQGRLQTS